MPVIPAVAPGARSIAPPGIEQARAEWILNSSGMPYRRVRVYNGTGGTLVKGAVYGIGTSGAALTTPNPRLLAPSAQGARPQQWVVALEATATSTWAWVCDWGYCSALVEGTTDVAADDNLVPVSGQTYLVQGGASSLTPIAEALEAQTANSAVLKAIFLRGDTVAMETGVSQYAEVSITSAQIKAIRATPISLVAAPGAGKILEFVSAQLYHDYGGTNVFTESTNNLAVRYATTTGAIASETIEMTGFIDATADTMTSTVTKIDVIVAKSVAENAALVLHNTSGSEIAGNAGADNVVRVKTVYRTHQTGW